MFSESTLRNFNDLDFAIYRAILRAGNKVPDMQAKDLAAEAHVSASSVVRFCKKVGCSGFSEFKYRFRDAMRRSAAPRARTSIEMGALLQFAKRLEDESFLISFQKAFEVLLASEQVLLLGTGYSGHLAGLGARMFRNVGRLALAADDPFPHISDVVAHRIVVIVISFSGETTQMLGMAKVFSEAGCPIIAVTSSPDSTLARLADITLATLASDLPVHDYLNFGTNAPTLYVLEMLVRRIWEADHMQEDGSSVAITRS